MFYSAVLTKDYKKLIENNKKPLYYLVIIYCLRTRADIIMQKDELIQLHTFLLQLKTHLECMVKNNGGKEFIYYQKLNVTPYQVYKSKREHKLAVFALSKGIADLLSNNNHPGLEKISNRLDQMAIRFMTNKEREEFKRS